MGRRSALDRDAGRGPEPEMRPAPGPFAFFTTSTLDDAAAADREEPGEEPAAEIDLDARAGGLAGGGEPPPLPAPPLGAGHLARGATSARHGAADLFSLPDDPASVLPALSMDFDASAMLRPQREPPAGGWRRAVHSLTGGRVSPAPSRTERQTRELVAVARRPVIGSRTIAVVSTKGGVGKTTTALNLGHTFAGFRGDRVVALDANPDAGSLGYRLPRETGATALDLLVGADDIRGYADIRAYTSQASSRLEVIASPDDPRTSRSLGRDEYCRLLALLADHYNLIVADCGTGILDAATRGVVQSADQLVVVTGPSVDSARAVTFLLAWLAEHGLAERVADAVVVLNGVRRRTGAVDVRAVEQHFAGRVRATVPVPWDRELSAGATAPLDALAPATRDAYLHLAAAVAAGFPGAPARDRQHVIR